ncbi:MAG: hypothetical protein HXN12_04285 [Porphyromonadaceae bacterium]|nr:hypothetical protein [Porphyromonadaceae bacterium]
MKFNLLKSSALLCGLFLLGSCAQEAPQAENMTQLENGPRVVVPIELEVSVDAFDAPKSLDQEARYAGVKTPITVKDGNNKELNDDLTAGTLSQKILTRSRDKFVEKNQTLDAVVYIYIKKGATVLSQALETTLSYDSGLRKYVLPNTLGVDENIIKLAGKSPDEFTLTVYAGGVSYNSTTKSFELPSVMHEVSLSSLESTPLELQLLYKSAPVAYKVDGTGASQRLKPAGAASPILKPLGSLLLVTFRNNMQGAVTFDGITAVSNSFFGPNNENKTVSYSIESGAFSNTVGYKSSYAKSSNGGSDYTYFFKDFSSSFSVPAGGARSDKAFVFWGFHTGGSTAVSPSNKLTAANGSAMEANAFAPSTSVLHVYGQNVKVGDQTPSRPNYSIAPIGGANLTPESGKAYTLNCEFYEQPRQMLGYFAKGYVYKENNVTWKDYNFDGGGSNDPSLYLKKSPSQGSGFKNKGQDDRKTTADNILLVNSWQADEVRKGVTTTKGKMYLPNEDWLNLIGLTRPLEFERPDQDLRYKDLAGFTPAYRGQVVPAQLPYKDDPSASTPFQSKGFVYADYHVASQTLPENGLGTVYRQLYMEPRNSKGYQPRSKYQTIMRVMTTGNNTYVEDDDGFGTNFNIYPSTLTMESLYVGKYFVGNVMTTPLYATRTASQPFLYAEDGNRFWQNPEVARDRVDRALLNVPTFDHNQISEFELLQDAGRAEFGNKTKAAPLMNHWGDAPSNVWYSKIIGKYSSLVQSVIDESSVIAEGDRNQTDNRIYGFADPKGGIWVIAQRYNIVTYGSAWDKEKERKIVKGRMRTYTYQVLRPYSTKYQGNEGFRNNSK